MKPLKILLIISFFLFCHDSLSQNNKEITITAVGDMMLGTNYPSSSYLPSNCYSLIKDVKEILNSSDITFANLEENINLK